VFLEHKRFKLLFKNSYWCGTSDVSQKTLPKTWSRNSKGTFAKVQPTRRNNEVIVCC